MAAAPLPDMSGYEMVVSHKVEWLWWDNGASGTLEFESMQQAMSWIADMHIQAGELGRELSTVYTRKTYREGHPKP
jgi:hypothetical protein